MRRRSTDLWRCVDSPRALVGLVGGVTATYVDRYKRPVKRVQPFCKRCNNKKARSKAGFSDSGTSYFGCPGVAGAAGVGFEKSTVGAVSELAGAS